MSDPIVVIDSSEIREGKLEELKTALEELAAFVEANEADPIAYNIYFDEDCTQMTVVQIHPSSLFRRQRLGSPRRQGEPVSSARARRSRRSSCRSRG